MAKKSMYYAEVYIGKRKVHEGYFPTAKNADVVKRRVTKIIKVKVKKAYY